MTPVGPVTTGGQHFTAAVREELAHLELGSGCCRRAELSALLRFGGSLTLRGGPVEGDGERFGAALTTGSGAVARRVRALLVSLDAPAPDVEVHQPGSLRRTTAYRVLLRPGPAHVLGTVGLLDSGGRPVEGVPAHLRERACDRAAYARGALIAAGSVSDPVRAPHLEVQAPGEQVARDLARILGALIAGAVRVTVGVGARGERWRVTSKSGAAIGVLLARTGAHTAFLRWDQERLRRELRWEANRVANADRANLSRAVEASGRQRAAIGLLLGSPEWEALGEGLKEVALARLANPELSLTELGGLLDPPVGKATVHRRLRQVEAAARWGRDLDAG